MLLYLAMIDIEEDKSKFEELYIKYRQTMFYVAKGILKDNHLAEDAVHMAFIKIINNISKIDKIDCPKTKGFIVIIVERVSIDIYRKIKKENVTSIDEVSYSKELAFSVEENYDENNELASAIARLPENYRQVIILKFSQGFSDDEISNILDISKDNVAKRIQRGKKKLKSFLSEVGGI